MLFARPRNVETVPELSRLRPEFDHRRVFELALPFFTLNFHPPPLFVIRGYFRQVLEETRTLGQVKRARGQRGRRDARVQFRNFSAVSFDL